ncbi:MAG TPA: MFS transporter [Bryobacteraceae bacterium]|nr:MFS transporter [Bryobacteraceae bacterium]
MIVETAAPFRKVTRLDWVVLLLLVVSVAINYVDRGILSVSGVALSKELDLKPHQLGFLLSAFFWTYAGFQLISGWLIDRYNVLMVFAIGFAVWSTATALTGVVKGFAALFVLRLLLGVGESVAYPSYSKIIAAGFPERQRGVANGLIDVGCKLGPATGMIVGGLILVRYGWRMVFLSIGVASLLWLVPWFIAAPKIGAVSVKRSSKLGPGFLAILSRKDAWGTLLGLFCANYGWYFMLTWLPQYLLMERHYSTRMMALTGWLPFCATAAGATLGGFLSDLWIRRDGAPTLVRKTFVVGGLTGSALLLLPAAAVADQVAAMSLLILAAFIYGLYSSNLWAITQTLAGTLAAGKWTGLQNCAGNVAGIAAPVVTGFIVERTGSFYFAFFWVCVNLLISAASYLFIVGKVEPVAWTSIRSRASTG